MRKILLSIAALCLLLMGFLMWGKQGPDGEDLSLWAVIADQFDRMKLEMGRVQEGQNELIDGALSE